MMRALLLLILALVACDTGAARPGGDSDIPRAALRFCSQIAQCNPDSFVEHGAYFFYIWGGLDPAKCAEALASQMRYTADAADEPDDCVTALVVYHDCVSDMNCGDYLRHREDVNARVPRRACWEYVLTVWDVCR